MATKSAGETLIAGRADGGGNLISTERDLWNYFLTQVYPDKEEDDQDLETFTIANSNFDYHFTIIKQGRSVFLDGSYRNKTFNILGAGSTVFDFEATEYVGDDSEYNGLNCKYQPSKIVTVGSLSAGQSVKFSIRINTNI